MLRCIQLKYQRTACIKLFPLSYLAGPTHTCATCHKVLGQQEKVQVSSMPRQDERKNFGLKDRGDERHMSYIEHVADTREQEVKAVATEQYHKPQDDEKEHTKPKSDMTAQKSKK